MGQAYERVNESVARKNLAIGTCKRTSERTSRAAALHIYRNCLSIRPRRRLVLVLSTPPNASLRRIFGRFWTFLPERRLFPAARTRPRPTKRKYHRLQDGPDSPRRCNPKSIRGPSWKERPCACRQRISGEDGEDIFLKVIRL